MTTVHRWIWISVLALPLVLAIGACGDDGNDATDDAGIEEDSGPGVDSGPGSLCDPACDPSLCTVCDTSGETPACVNVCGDGSTCEDGLCVAPEVSSCDPACGPCQACDTSGDAPECIAICGEGTSCEDGVCVPPPPDPDPACDPACGECEVCDLSGETPVCISRCGSDELCQAGTCIDDSVHANTTALDGPFDTGQDVTAACIECHQEEAEAFLETSHWNWVGPAPNVVNHDGDGIEVGKRTLINNFCVATVSNEKRCNQCHSGYGWEDDTFDFGDTANIDCLVCHADPDSGYQKGKKTAGLPVDTVDLELAAKSVGLSTRENCGSCHFYAGGGDNVKKGDLGSAMANPSFEQDVHMGLGFSCGTCHEGSSHGKMVGTAAHMPVEEGRVDCSDCHTAEPHASATYNEHALDIACQTCHVPSFSRGQPTKMNWDWSTAGNKTRGTDGVEMGTVGPYDVQVYNFMKGDFVWEHEVPPEYAWYDGRVRRLTIFDSYANAGTEADPVEIAVPVAGHADEGARIWPFKVMRGRQPAHSASQYLIVPHLFGPGGFWPGIPDAADYTEEAVHTLWTTALTDGAIAAGQLAEGASYAEDEWEWAYTEMYMNINHEVAPASEALGAGGACNDCHDAAGALDFTALGYSCDPMTDAEGCGSRHY